MEPDRLTRHGLNRASLQRPVVDVVISQHVDDLAILWNTRQSLATSGHVALRHLARIDSRIAAHLDGCLVAQDAGVQKLSQGFSDPDPSRLFAGAVTALAAGDGPLFERCLAIAEGIPASLAGVISAIGWVSSSQLSGVVPSLLAAESAVRRRAGVAAYRLHGADPGQKLTAILQERDPGVRAEAQRTAGEIGRSDLLPFLGAAVRDADEAVAFWA